MNLIHYENGEIKAFDLDMTENELENKIGKAENRAMIFRAFAEPLYGMFDDDLKFDVLTGAIHADLEKEVPEEAMVKFERDGWELA